MAIKAILIDIGGVICQDIEKHMFKDVAKQYHKNYDELMRIRSKWWQLYATDKITEKQYWEGLLSDAKIDGPIAKFLPQPYQYIKKMPGMVPLVKRLHQRYPLYLISDHAREWWTFAQTKYQLASFFQKEFLSYELKILKVNPMFFTKVLQQLHYAPEECLVVDNAEASVRAARAHGFQTLLFKDPEQLRRELRKRKLL